MSGHIYIYIFLVFLRQLNRSSQSTGGGIGILRIVGMFNNPQFSFSPVTSKPVCSLLNASL